MDADIKQDIIISAREIFGDKGYQKTSMQDFADKLQIPLDDLLVCYDDKFKIAEVVYSELYFQINEALLNSGINISDSLLLLFTAMRIFYEIILSDKKNAEFTCDVLKQEAGQPVVFSFLSDIYWTIVKDYAAVISKRELDLMLLSDNAAQRELIISYMNGNLNEFDIDNIFIFLQSAIPRLLKIDHSFIDNMLLKSISIAKAIDKKDLKLLN